jgi:hypothetical protein
MLLIWNTNRARTISQSVFCCENVKKSFWQVDRQAITHYCKEEMPWLAAEQMQLRIINIKLLRNAAPLPKLHLHEMQCPRR